MNHSTCCVPQCKNNGRNSKYDFYRFPSRNLEQRNKWISAIKRIEDDGSPYIPKPSHRICSSHFIGGKKSNIMQHPAYVPSIFQFNKHKIINEQSALKRHERFMERRKRNVATISSTSEQKEKKMFNYNYIENNVSKEVFVKPEVDESNERSRIEIKIMYDKQCQVDIFTSDKKQTESFTCISYVYESKNYCEVNIQTNIIINSKIIIQSNKKFKDKQCETETIKKVDASVGPSFFQDIQERRQFSVFSSIKTDRQLLDITGVTFNTFQELLKRVHDSEKYKVAKEDRLLLYLIKMKTGLTFSALSVFFNLHRTSVTSIFNCILQELN